jgi:predicted transcriptional regulator
VTAATPGQAAYEALSALLDEVLDDVQHVVDGNPDWIDRDMLSDYSERAEAIAAQQPQPAPGRLAQIEDHLDSAERTIDDYRTLTAELQGERDELAAKLRETAADNIRLRERLEKIERTGRASRTETAQLLARIATRALEGQ